MHIPHPDWLGLKKNKLFSNSAYQDGRLLIHLLYLEKRLFTEEKLGEVKEEFERTETA